VRLVLVGLGLAGKPGVGCPVWGGDSNPGRGLSKTCPGLGGWPAPGLTPFDRMSRNPPIPRPKWLVASYCVAPEWLTDKSER
jgi:hypothetical protein